MDIARNKRLAMVVVTASLFANLFALMLHWYSRKGGNLLFESYAYPLTLMALGILLSGKGSYGRVEHRLAAFFVAWYMLTRIINGMLYLVKAEHKILFLIASMCIAFPYPSIVSGRIKAAVETAFGTVVLAFFTAVSWLSLYAVITKQALRLPHAAETIALGSDGRLWIWSIHPNITACIYSVCCLAILFHLFRQKKPRHLLIPAVVVWASCYTMIALTVSRSAMILTALSMGVIAAIRISRTRPNIGRFLKKGIALLAAIIAISLTYAGYSAVICGVEHLANRWVQSTPPHAIERQTPKAGDGDDLKADEQAAADSMSLVARRSYENEWYTLNGRTGVYVATLQTLKEHPYIFLFGYGESAFMPLVNSHSSREYAHTHNSFLQVLMTCGLGGLIPMVWLVVLIVKQGIFLIIKKDFLPSDVLLGMIPLIIIAHSMLEPFIFMNYNFVNLLFFAYAGIMVNRSYEIKNPTSQAKAWLAAPQARENE